MVQLAILGVLTGAVLGLRFRVGSLIAATAVLEISIGGLSLLAGQSGTTTLLTMIASAAALQAGYLMGTLTRFTVAAARSSGRVTATASMRTTHQLRAD